jgi:hypothetical protein
LAYAHRDPLAQARSNASNDRPAARL